MQLHVALLPEQLPKDWRSRTGTVAIVVDTLRFTTTACQALSAGARSVRVASEIDEARSLAAKATQKTLLCGERLCRPIDGFDLGNSPLEYKSPRISAVHLIFTTTNGTRAVSAARGAASIWLAAMVNRHEVVKHLRDLQPKCAWFVCAGTDGEVALEDVLVAGAVIDQLGVEPSGDAAQLAWFAWKAITAETTDAILLPDVLQKSFASAVGGRNLIETGFSSDVQFAARIDSIDTVPKSASAWDVFESW